MEGIPLPISSNYALSDLTSEGVGNTPVISSNDCSFKSSVKVESGGSGGRRRMSSSSGPPLDDQGQLYMYGFD